MQTMRKRIRNLDLDPIMAITVVLVIAALIALVVAMIGPGTAAV